jgi:hypothetical protein
MKVTAFVLMLDSDPFKFLHHPREKRVRDLWDDNAKNSAATTSERPRLRIRVVTMLVDDGPYPHGKARIDCAHAVNGSRTVALETRAHFAISRMVILQLELD